MYTYHITINVSYHYGDTPLPTACHHENTIIPLYIYIYKYTTTLQILPFDSTIQETKNTSSVSQKLPSLQPFFNLSNLWKTHQTHR